LPQTNDIHISHETVYQHILKDKKNGGNLYTHLRRSGKKYKKRCGAKDTRGSIKNRTPISERPPEMEKKERLGDWEGDTVIGKNHKGALVTLVDRVSKETLIAKVNTRKADAVANAVINLLKSNNYPVETITFDNGKEFAYHERIAKKLKAAVYFAEPYSSWQRGLNENTNGLIRQYFPKGSSFEGIEQEDIKQVMEKLNNRPRKGLGFATPIQTRKALIVA